MLNALVSDIQQKLNEPLPGLHVQRRMSAVPHSSRIQFKHSVPPRQGSVLILMYQDNEHIRIPLILRPEYDGAHGGQISLPGGKQEEQDPDLLITALRETYEEIGVDQDDVSIIGTLTELYIIPSNFNVLPVVGFTESIPEFVPDPMEVELVVPARLDHFLDHSRKKRKNIVVRETFRLDAPYYDINDQVVWGATAMIMSEFEEIVRSIGYYD